MLCTFIFRNILNIFIAFIYSFSLNYVINKWISISFQIIVAIDYNKIGFTR